MLLKNRLNHYLITSFFLVCLSTVSLANKLTFQQTVKPETATIGAILQYELTCTYNARELQLFEPEIIDVPGFFIRDHQAETTEITKDQKVFKQTILFSSFQIGNQVFPTRNILLRDKTGKQISQILPAINLKIQSVLNPQDKELQPAPLKQPLRLNYNWKLITFSTILLILAGTGIYFLIWKLLRKKKKANNLSLAPAVIDPRAAYEIALDDLARLKNSNLLKKDLIKEYYIQLTEIVKIYFSRNYQQKIVELTTAEIMQFFSKGFEEQTVKRIRKFFELGDMVKFARLIPSDAENEENFNRAVEIINRTKLLKNDSETQNMKVKS